tara:strand:- start:55 stop:522 length:468 start_codon:yes stop_codon:yes gene_type:complete
MTLKINISEKGKTYKLELENDVLAGKAVGDNVQGADVSADLEGYELEITGGSDIAGFPMKKDVEGIGLKRVLFTKGWGMRDSRKGLRLRKTVRGKTIADSTVQVNFNVVKAGAKKLADVFGKKEEKVAEGGEEKPAEEKKEEAVKEEAKPEEKKE